MLSGLLILAVTFISVGFLHYLTLTIASVSHTKNKKIQRFFWALMGVLFILGGVVSFIEEDSGSWFAFFRILFGVVVCGLALFFHTKL